MRPSLATALVLFSGCAQLIGIDAPAAHVSGDAATTTPDSAIGDTDGGGTPPSDGGSSCDEPVDLAFGPTTNYSVGQSPQAVAIGDLDQDGRDDLVVAYVQAGAAGLALFLNQGGSSLGAKQDIAIPCSAGALVVVIGDLNGDGRNDLLVQGASCSNTFSLFVLLQEVSPAGTFATPVAYEHLGVATSAAIADLDGDGRNDLIAASKLGDDIAVFRQDPTTPGLFLPREVYTVGASVSSLQIGDLDHDTHPDLVFIKETGGFIAQWMPQNPSDVGTFLGARDVASSPGTSKWLGAGELNGDGRCDVVAGGGTGTVLLQRADLPGQFLDGGHVDAEVSIVVADVNQDGRNDIISASGVALQCATTPGAFPQVSQRFPGGLVPTIAVAVGDLNDDGKQDFATLPAGSTVSSVFLQP